MEDGDIGSFHQHNGNHFFKTLETFGGMALSDLRGTQSLFSQRKSDVIYRQAAVFLESILKEKNTAKECYSRKKAVWKWGVLCGSDEIANIEGSGSIFHQHVWRMVGRVSYWVEHSGLMVVRKCGRVFESLFLVFFHVKVMPSVYCQRPGSTFVQMVPSCIWESPIAPEPSPLPLLSSLISSPSSFSPPSYLSFRPNLLLLLSLFLSCLAASHLEHQFLTFFSSFYLHLCFVSLASPVCWASLLLLPSSFPSLNSSSFSISSRVSEEKRLWKEARLRLEGGTDSAAPPDPLVFLFGSVASRDISNSNLTQWNLSMSVYVSCQKVPKQ